LGGAATAEGNAGEEVEWERRCCARRRHGSGRAWSGKVRLRVSSEHALLEFNMVSKEVDGVQHLCLEVWDGRKEIAVRDQDVGIVEFESPYGYY
jgi:hypothetical protein